jgi:hypothetical protein
MSASNFGPSGIVPRSIELLSPVQEFSAASLAQTDVVLVTAAFAPTITEIELLASFVRRGGGLFVFRNDAAVFAEPFGAVWQAGNNGCGNVVSVATPVTNGRFGTVSGCITPNYHESFAALGCGATVFLTSQRPAGVIYQQGLGKAVFVCDEEWAMNSASCPAAPSYNSTKERLFLNIVAFITPPANRVSVVGGSACRGDHAVVELLDSGDGSSLQWRKDGVPIDTSANPSAATSRLVIENTQPFDAGSYDCVVTTACGDVISNPADLDVDCNCIPATPLNITAGVADGFSASNGAEPATPRSGFAAHLEARNPRPFLPFDLVPSGGTENRFLAHSFVGLPGDLSSARVEFRVRAGGSNNAVAEGTDLFRVGHSIAVNDFQGVQTYFGNENSPSLFTFPWRLWTVDPRGDQTITTADLSQTILDRMNTLGYLDFMVEDDTGVDYVTLRAMRAAKRSGINVPWVRTQPNQTTIACPGTAVNLAAAAGGSGPFTYQWRLNGTPVDAGANPSASTPTLSLIRAKGADSGVYDCVITNACTSVTTSPATLSVCASDFNCDGFVTFEDFDSFVSAFETGSPSADFNADGFLTFEDFDAAVQAFEAGC